MVSFTAGQWIATKAARDQRSADASEREKERASAAAQADKIRESQEREARAQREAAAQEAAEARTDALFVQALDAIHALQGALTAFPDSGSVPPGKIREFSTALNRLRMFGLQEKTGSYYDVSAMVNRIVDLQFRFAHAEGADAQAAAIIAELGKLADSVAEDHRHLREQPGQGV